VFKSPDELILDRQPNPHVSLGGGIHYCLGAPLARLEIQIAVPAIIRKFPNLALADQPTFRNNYHFHGLEALNVKADGR
jgi:cytochrome P450